MSTTLPLRARRAVAATLAVPTESSHSFRWDVLAGACAGAFQGITFPFFVRIARVELHASEFAIALMMAAPFVGNLLSPLWARRMEGREKMPFCLGSWITARSLLFLMPLLAFTPTAFVGLVFGMQFIGTISAPAYTSLMRDIYPDRARGRLMGYVRVGTQTLMFLATMAAGRLIDHGVSFQLLFPFAGMLGIGAALAFSRVRPIPVEAPPPPGPADHGYAAFVLDTLTILRDNVGYRWFALSVFFYGFGNLMVQPLYALYQNDRLHITGTQIANLANFASLVAIAGFFFWGRQMDKWGASRTVMFGILLFSFVPIVYMISPTIPMLFVAAALMGFGSSCIELAYVQNILSYAEPGRAAQYQSLHSLLLGLRGVAAPLVAVRLLHGFGYQTVFAIAFGVMVIGGLMQWAATALTLRESAETPL